MLFVFGDDSFSQTYIKRRQTLNEDLLANPKLDEFLTGIF